MSTRKFLVTGAAGFIGSHLCDRLLEEGATVVGIDDYSLGRPENLREARRSSHFRIWQTDINNAADCSALIEKESQIAPIDAVWHLAANSDILAGVSNAQVDFNKTFLTTFNCLAYCRQFGIKEFFFASTSAIYGNQPGQIHEDIGPLFPISNYGAMKLASEASISAALETFLERAWIFRFPNVVGSRATHGAIYDFIRKLRATPHQLEVLGDGEQQKPYLHVDDLIDAMIYIRNNTREKLNYFNIAESRTSTRVADIAAMVVSVVSPVATIRYTGGSKGWPGDVPKFTYSTQKLESLGWHPKLDSDQAVALAVRQIAKEQ